MRSIACSAGAVILAVGLCTLPANASSEKPLGVVTQAQHAHLDNASAAMGASIYAGDTFETESGGTLRLRFGSSQIYLLASSAVKVAESSTGALITVTRGTVGISSSTSGQVALETPAGIVRGAEGKPAYGQVTITNPAEIIVSAYRGELILDNEGELHSIPEGKAYRVVIEPDQEQTSQEPTPANNPEFHPAENHHRKRRLAFYLIFTGAVAIATYELWVELAESPTKFDH
ncbi:MAG: hypothetical protein WB780_20670 [Candidatus Acidiferrales bacterium]